MGDSIRAEKNTEHWGKTFEDDLHWISVLISGRM